MAQATDGTAELQKTAIPQPAVLLYLPYSPLVTEKAFHDYLSKITNKEQKEATSYLLSTNTTIAKSNVSNADMHFFIGYRANKNKNESVIYLTLNSLSKNEYSLQSSAYHFNSQEAKEYLNNLAIAIQPYAAILQRKLQEEDLKNAQEENKSLTNKSNKLQAKRKSLNYQISENERESKVAHLAKRKVRNDRKIGENVTALNKSNYSINEQKAALALLKQ
jgi:hypothetical protein